MEALNQYIDLYRHHSKAFLDAGPALAALRPGALATLERFAAQPAPRSAYARSSVEALLAPDYGVNIARAQAPALESAFTCGVPNVSTLMGVTVNDVFRPSAGLLARLPRGVTVESLAEAARRDSASLAPYLNKLAADSSAAAALNALMVQDGVVVRVAAGVRLEKPVQLVNLFSAPMPMVAMRRVLVVMEKDASARILLCDHTRVPDTDYLSNEVVEVFAAEGSSIEIYGIEESTPRTNRISSFYARLQSRARLSVCDARLSGGTGATDMHIDLAGPHAEADINGLTIAEGSEIRTTDVHLRHLVPDCRSRQLFKYALFGQACGAFGGKIVVEEGAVRTDAAQTNRNLLASQGARMASAPQLEIYCDDVRCSHGATTGQIDERALFYMQTRGIPREQARLMLTQAFMADVVDTVAFDLIRDRLHQLVERRLSGQSASCAACSTSNPATCHE